MIQDLFGGDLLIADVTGGDEQDEVHYWNRLIGGLEIDLAREQFEPHRLIGQARVVVRPAGGPRRHVDSYELLRSRVLAALGHPPVP